MQDNSRPNTPVENFLRSAQAALQRRSSKNAAVIPPDWVLSSLEVDFTQDDLIGQGGFGKIYKGDWNGAVCPQHFLLLKTLH